MTGRYVVPWIVSFLCAAGCAGLFVAADPSAHHLWLWRALTAIVAVLAFFDGWMWWEGEK